MNTYKDIFNQIEKIKLKEDELSEYKFINPNTAAHKLTKRLARRLPHCLNAIKNGTVVYLENGNMIAYMESFRIHG